MGLKLTLPKSDNPIGIDFVDAYWSISNIEFITANGGDTMLRFKLYTYPSREAKYLHNTLVPNSDIQFGTSESQKYSTVLHVWSELMKAEIVFPNGIPLKESDQKDVLYRFVKEYTGLPFEDVFEE